MILGCYYVSFIDPEAKGTGTTYGNMDEVSHAVDAGALDMRAKINLRMNGEMVYSWCGCSVIEECVVSVLVD